MHFLSTVSLLALVATAVVAKEIAKDEIRGAGKLCFEHSSGI